MAAAEDEHSVDEELQTLGLAGLLFGLAVVAQRAGYSLALGAFLLGTIVAETPHRHQVERTFEGCATCSARVLRGDRDADRRPRARRLRGAHRGVAAFTLLARLPAVTAGLALIGTRRRTALRAGLTVTPIGEFSFMIAQLGVIAAVVPRSSIRWRSACRC